MKYRVGRKQMRAILDENGHEIALLHKGNEELAKRLCNLLNLDENKDIIDILKSDSVYTLLRFGSKSPSRSGMDDCEDDGYSDLYDLVCELRKG